MNILDFKKGKKISMVTCYDYSSAKILEKTNVDSLLVGDSLAMVVYGYESTLPATIAMMAAHTQAVRKGAPSKFIVADLPFLSFKKGLKIAMDCVQKVMVAGANAVKLEGVDGHEDVIKNIVDSGVPVMGHLGLTPQSINEFGGHKVQGKSSEQGRKILEQAKRLERLGCFSIVLECIPTDLSDTITKELSIPTIGIGAGARTDGQVLVFQDLLGFDSEFNPKFLRKFANLEESISQAINEYHDSVTNGSYPSASESYRDRRGPS